MVDGDGGGHKKKAIARALRHNVFATLSKCVPYSFCCFWTVNLSSLINNISESGVSQIVLSTPVHCHDDGNMRREAMCAVPSLSHESRSRIHWRIEYQREFRAA